MLLRGKFSGHRALLISLFFSLAAAFCFPESADLKAWYREDRKAAKYEEIRSLLESIFAAAEQSDIPAVLLTEKLKQGSAKNVSPGRLADAMNSELARLIIAEGMVSDYCESAVSTEERVSLIRGISIFLSGSLSKNELEFYLSMCCEKGSGSSKFLSLGGAMLGIQTVEWLSPDQRLSLAESLLGSSVPPSGYNAVSSIFLKGKLNRLSPAEVLEIVTSSLSRGGGIIQMEDELNRRSRKK